LDIQSTTEAQVLQDHDLKIQSESEEAVIVDSRESPEIVMQSDTRAISSRELTTEPKNTEDNETNAFLLHPQSLFVNLIVSVKGENEVFCHDLASIRTACD
jgi:hypothetical protein